MIFMIVIGILLIALNVYVFYISFGLTLAVWRPEKAQKKWKEFMRTPAAMLCYPIIKWISPVLMVTIPLQTAAGLFSLYVEFFG